VSVPLVGLRIGALQPMDAVSYHQILVATPHEAMVTQGTLRGEASLQRLALQAQVPWVVTDGGGLHDAGLGRLRAGGGVWLGREWAWQVGLEAAMTPGGGPRATVLAWGTRARDTVEGLDVSLVVSYAEPEGRWGLRTALGAWLAPALSEIFGPVADLTLVHQSLFDGPWQLAQELDVCSDPTWMTWRPLVRYGAPSWHLDLGLQLPLPALGRTVTLQPFVQLRVW
jgi:hypothetical protein